MTFYVLICRKCSEGQALTASPIPFGSAEERGKWAAAHTKGTGHDSWIVLDVPEKENYRED